MLPAVLQELASKLALSKLDCEETPKSGGTKRSLRTRPDHLQQLLAPDVNQVKSMHVSDTAQQSNSSHDLNLLCACLEQLVMRALLQANWHCSTCKVHSRMYNCRSAG